MVRIPSRFHVSRCVIWIPPCQFSFSLTGLFTLSAGFPQNLLLESLNQLCGRTRCARNGFKRFSISLAATLEIDVFFLFLRLLRCFSSPGSPLPYVMDWRMDDWSPSSRVSPDRHLRIKDYLHLPAAFRSLSRLSSALSAKGIHPALFFAWIIQSSLS